MTPDQGQQPERTALAWQRTALSAFLVAALLARKGLTTHAPLDVAASLLTTTVALLALRSATPTKTATSAPRLILLCTLLTTSGLLTILQLATAS